MPIVKGDGTDIKIAVSAEMDKKSQQEVLVAVQRLSAEERAAIENQIKGERLLAQIEADRAKQQAAIVAKQQATAKAQQDAIRAQEAAQNKYRSSLMKTREEAQRLAGIANQVSVVGAAMMAPFVAATAKFASSASASDSVAREYRASMASLENSTIRLGRATAEVLNPILKETAKITSDVVGFLEKNPHALEAFLGIGATLAIGGQVAKLALGFRAIQATLALSGIGAGGAAAAGVTAAGGAAAGSTAAGAAAGAATTGAAAIAPVVVAVLATAAVVTAVAATTDYVMKKSMGLGLKEALSAELEFVKRLPEVVTGKIQANELAAMLIEAAINKTGGTAPPVSTLPGGTITPTSRRRDFEAIATASTQNAAVLNYKKQFEAEDAAAEKEKAEKRLAALKDYQTKRESVEASIAETTRSYLLAEKNAFDDYLNSRLDVARAAGIEAERAEEDHQKALRKIQKDSDQRLYSMRLERDALGIATEKRNAETQRKETEETYRTEVRRKNQDLAERLRIMDREFSAANQRRLAEYQWNLKLKNAEVDAAYKAYTAIVQAANAMVAAVTGASQSAASAAQVIGTATRLAASAASSAGSSSRNIVRAYADGGTVDRTGPAIVHQDEIVLNRQNRRFAENLIGGNLTQAGIMDLIKTAAQGRSAATINNNFGNSLTTRQVVQLVDMSSQSLLKAFTRSIRQAG